MSKPYEQRPAEEAHESCRGIYEDDPIEHSGMTEEAEIFKAGAEWKAGQFEKTLKKILDRIHYDHDTANNADEAKGSELAIRTIEKHMQELIPAEFKPAPELPKCRRCGLIAWMDVPNGLNC